MTATVGQAPSAPTRTTVRPLSRVYGLGTVYAKTLRDSRLAVLIVAGMMFVLLVSSGVAFGRAYASEQSRQDLANLVSSLPAAMQGVYGNPFPVNITTLGGSTQWKSGASMGLLAALWSILALSGTLAREARRGSLDFVATAPLGMRRIAVEKLAAHLTGMAIVVLVTTVSAYLAGMFGALPGDAIPWDAAFGFGLWIGVVALASGSVAWLLAPVVGRGPSAAIAGAVLLIGYFANGYQAAVPAFASLANVTWWGWTVHHQPLAGQLDWASLVPGAVVAGVLFAVGTWLFATRDLGRTTRIPWPGLPSRLLGLGGPLQRSFGERFSTGVVGDRRWGDGVHLRRGRDLVHRRAREAVAADTVDLPECLPERGPAVGCRRLPPARLRDLRVHPRRLRRGDAGRRLGLGRERRAAGDAALGSRLAVPLGDRGRPRGVCGHRAVHGDGHGRHRPRQRDHGRGRRDAGGRNARPRAICAGPGGRRPRVGRPRRDGARGRDRRVPRDPHLPDRPARPRAAAPGVAAPARADVAPGAADGRGLGLVRDGVVRRA